LVHRRAPGRFVAHLSHLAASAGGQVVALNTQRAKLSQRCQCGVEEKKPPQRLGHPVVSVSWHDASLYATWLSHVVGEPWRLPIEVEWERAAWGAVDERIYPWGTSSTPPAATPWRVAPRFCSGSNVSWWSQPLGRTGPGWQRLGVEQQRLQTISLISSVLVARRQRPKTTGYCVAGRGAMAA
jgi:formylglycine-generating enzyme required for sulfatase activity